MTKKPAKPAIKVAKAINRNPQTLNNVIAVVGILLLAAVCAPFAKDPRASL